MLVVMVAAAAITNKAEIGGGVVGGGVGGAGGGGGGGVLIVIVVMVVSRNRLRRHVANSCVDVVFSGDRMLNDFIIQSLIVSHPILYIQSKMSLVSGSPLPRKKSDFLKILWW